MSQPSLFMEPETQPSVLCSYSARPCPKRVVCEYGPPVARGEAVNREIVCLTCGRTGTESVRSER